MKPRQPGCRTQVPIPAENTLDDERLATFRTGNLFAQKRLFFYTASEEYSPGNELTRRRRIMMRK